MLKPEALILFALAFNATVPVFNIFVKQVGLINLLKHSATSSPRQIIQGDSLSTQPIPFLKQTKLKRGFVWLDVNSWRDG